MDIDDLIEDARNGVTNAGPLLVSVLGSQLVAYARKRGPDLSDVDRDLVVELAIEKAIRQIDRYNESRGSFPSWLRGFVRHEVLNWRRSHDSISELDHDPAAPAPEIDDEADVARRKELSALAQTALCELKDTDQAIIQLHTVEGIAYSDIAELLDVNEAACRQRHRRALIRLRAGLESHGVDIDAEFRGTHDLSN